MIELSEQQIIDQVADRLAVMYPAVPPARVTELVHEKYAYFDGRPVREFVPLFVERFAKSDLAQLVA